MQEIYLFMDDSGKLTKNESFCTYGGIVFTSHKEKQVFSNKYRNILTSIKCNYCEDSKECCNKQCPEIKSMLINKEHRRQIINLCKKFKTFSLIIDNDKIYDSIMESKASKGRYLDYTQKLTFKDIVTKLITEGLVNPKQPINFTINIDQQATKSNGYYNLRDGLYEELVHGYFNYNYGISGKPTIYASLTLNVNYIDSKKSVIIQAADIIAGTTRNIVKFNSDSAYIQQRLNTFNWYIRRFP